MPSLLDQVLARPDDEALRMVYADDLLGKGDPRGELIAVETQLAKHPGDAALAKRRRELKAAHAKAWWPELPSHRLRTRGGLVVGAALTSDEVATTKSLFEREPIRDVELIGGISDLDLHSRVERLAFHGTHGNSALEHVVGSPLAERLVALDCAGSFLTDPMPELAERLPRCRELVLAHNTYLSDIGPLLRWRHVAQAEVIDLRNTRVGLDAFKSLAQSQPRIARAIKLTTERRDPLELDLVGSYLVLAATTADRWTARVDDLPVRIRMRVLTRYDNGQTRIDQDWHEADSAPLGALAAALEIGTPRELDGDRASVQCTTNLGAVYNTSVYTSQTARITLPIGRVLEIELEEYVSID